MNNPHKCPVFDGSGERKVKLRVLIGFVLKEGI